MNQIETYSTACARLSTGVPLGALLFSMDNLPHKPPVLNVRFKGEDWGVDMHDYPSARTEKAKKSQATAAIKTFYETRVNRFRNAMKGRGPMTLLQVDELIEPTNRCSKPTSNGARRSLLRLTDSGEVVRTKDRREVFYRWIGE